jgi:hypothetical protein
MKHFATIVCLLALLWLAGCASLSADPRLVGTYSAENSEGLVFMPDGRVFHSEIVNEKKERFFLGYYASSSSSSGSLGFVGPDTSRFVGTSFTVSEDYSIVTASWTNLREPKVSWQVTYRRIAKAH